ncbi:MAG: dolichyl-phosphate-mannose--protein mannosyltransferase [Galactobacter sp.]
MTTTSAQPRSHRHPPVSQTTPREAFTLDSLMLRLTGTVTGRLQDVMGPARYWIVVAIVAFAGLLRFWNLGHPDKIIFDETYYVKDAWSYLHFGYEREWPKDINEDFAAGQATPSAGPEYVVHPPLGKWILALGMAILGTDNGFGWRAGAAAAGTLAVLFTMLAALRLFKRLWPAVLVGLFMAVDGQQLVLSRTGILDIFITLFVATSLYLALVDRDAGRRKLATAVGHSVGAGGVPPQGFLRWGPWMGWRPWRLALGVSLGCLCAVKWSGLWFVVVFGLLVVWWDCQARRTAGIRSWLASGVLRDGVTGFVQIIPTALITYVLTWTGWFLNSGAYGHGSTGRGPLPDLWDYHQQAYDFHNGLSSPHSAASNAWTWPFVGHPVLMLYDTNKDDGVACARGRECVQVVTDLSNPILWWAGTIGALVALWMFLGRRDWRALTILAGFVAGWVPWLFYPERTMFVFYTSGYQPFAVLAAVYALWLLCFPPGASAQRIRSGVLITAMFTALVLLASWWFWPVWTGETISPISYRLRMWLPNWP